MKNQLKKPCLLDSKETVSDKVALLYSEITDSSNHYMTFYLVQNKKKIKLFNLKFENFAEKNKN